MKTLESIIEQEVRAHVDDIKLCNDLVVAGTENPDTYDGIVSIAAEITEGLIKTNFKYIIAVASKEYEYTEPEEEELEQIEVDTNVSDEDKEMLAFIAS